MDAEQKRARDVLKELLNRDEGLRASDITFLESMDEQRDREWSEAQIEWLDDIYERVY